MAHLTATPIDLAALVDVVSHDAAGAVVTFTGIVRDHHAGRRVVALTYSAYETMAEAELAAIVSEASEDARVRVSAQHRLGALVVGDLAVAVAVAAPHRDDAFRICREVIDAIKARVPIWKHERYADGSEAWVDPTAPDGVVAARGVSA